MAQIKVDFDIRGGIRQLTDFMKKGIPLDFSKFFKFGGSGKGERKGISAVFDVATAIFKLLEQFKPVMDFLKVGLGAITYYMLKLLAGLGIIKSANSADTSSQDKKTSAAGVALTPDSILGYLFPDGKIEWTDFLQPMTWTDFITAPNWSQIFSDTISTIKLLFDPKTWITLPNWNEILSFPGWVTFINPILWGDWIKSVVWDDWLKKVDWFDWIKSLTVADWVAMILFPGWGIFIPKLDWSDFISKIKGFFSGGASDSIEDGIITKTGQVIKTDPNDTIYATKNPGIGMGNHTVMNFYGVTSQEVVELIKREMYMSASSRTRF